MFCDILEHDEDRGSYKVKVYLKGGQTVVGWTPTVFYPTFRIYNLECLFDGRFNL